MSNNQFIENEQDLAFSGFVPNEKQMLLIEKFKQIRNLFGKPDNSAYKKSLERTRQFTRTVYPNNISSQFTVDGSQ